MNTFFFPYKEYTESHSNYRYTDKKEQVEAFVKQLIERGYPSEKIVYEECGITINCKDTVLAVVVNTSFSSFTTYKLRYGTITLAERRHKLTHYDSHLFISLHPEQLKELPKELLADTEETKTVLLTVYDDYENGRLVNFPAKDEEKQVNFLKKHFKQIWQEKGYTQNHLDYKIAKSCHDFVKLLRVKKLEQEEVINQAYKIMEENHLQAILKNKDYDITPLRNAWQDKGYTGQELELKVAHSLPKLSAKLKELQSVITIQKVVRGHLTRKKIYLEKLESLPEIRALRQSISALYPSQAGIVTIEDNEIFESRQDWAKAVIKNLNNTLTNYLKKGDFSESSYNQFKESFNLQLRSKDSESVFSEYYRDEYESMVLANIAICLTVIGALAVIGKLIYSKITVGKATGFFDKTQISIQAEKIEETLEKVMPEIKI
ncbi:hypothetical protein [Legionella worsleiensis]|uniref:Ankyrin repeat protein n=1 Tax=Legionella worsleiensis TaxID=45076 RepID=A0A0W1AET6_9GAMM|nr:hypothetical protein [Legionella worsleiensis]KTD79862.1 Ankyrin repeat protein [Legionella worsleiensis]STY32374.1 Ankyrin repeat protein [Legionella worsleiensis]